jgi:uncharacterized protein DUF3352
MTDQDQSNVEATQVVETPAPLTPSPETAAPLTPAPVTPVEPVGGSPRSGRARWAVALGAVAIVAALSAAIVYALVGRSPDATVLGYVPSGAVVYGEVRLDLPGDQRREIGEFLAHFPGFADQAALDSKLDEVLDRLVSDASGGKQTFTTNIKPWFDGELAFSAGPLPDPKTIMSGAEGSGMDSARALALLSIKDEALARAWFADAFKQAGATTTTETYEGVELTLFSSPTGGTKAAFAILDGKVAVAGDVASVKAAVDTKGNGGFAADPDAKAALDAPTDDHLGFVYLALGPIVEWTQELGQAATGQDGAGAAIPGISTEVYAKFIPKWSAFWLRVEGDALVMEAAAPKAETQIGPTTDRPSDVAKHVPASAIALLVNHDMGATLKQTLELYKSEASLKEVTDIIDQGLGALGGADGAIGWIGDSGLVVNRSGDAIEGGLVIVPTDAAAAKRLFTSVQNLAALGGVEGVTFRDEDYKGTTISVASIDFGALGGGSAFAVPVDKIEIAWAVTDDLVVLGSGPEFVKHVLDTTDATSLASNDRYEALLARVKEGTGSVFVDIAAIRDHVEAMVKSGDAASLKEYETNVKPFLEPFDALIASSSVGGDLTRSTIVITVQ